MRFMKFTVALALAAWTLPALVQGQNAFPPDANYTPGSEGSRNIKVVSHVPLGRMFTMTDVEVEQEMSRPYAYVSRMHGINQSAGFNIISLKNPEKAQSIYYWHIDQPELHKGMGGMAPMYLKSKGRYYFTQSFQWAAGSPDSDLGAVVFDVTGLPDTSKVKEVARIRMPENPGGFHESFAYKHSNGEALVFFQVSGPFAAVYDIDQVVANAPNKGLVAKIPVPENPQAPLRGYHDFYVGYDPANHRDVFYGAGNGGYHVYDITDLQNAKLLTSVTGASGVSNGHTFTPDPTGRYVVAETEYQYAPLRIFDLKPGLDGTVKNISRPIGAWTARWKGLAHNHEVRWPYVFVSGYEDGLQVFNMMDPTNPYTVGYYDTYPGPNQRGWGGVDDPEGSKTAVTSGAFGIDVRNADGLILIADFHTGFWAFHMDGFDGWNGHQWGLPNISSAQDWDNGPEGAPKKVT